MKTFYEKLARTEQRVLCLLEACPERHFGVTEIVDLLKDQTVSPIEIKIAATNLVLDGKARMDDHWRIAKKQ